MRETEARVAALATYGILDTGPEAGFDDIVLLATRICETPVALVSLVERDRQWFKARVGFPSCETPLSQSVCAHALVEGETLVIPDLASDTRTRDNTLVTADPRIRFYAGAVLKTPGGVPLGTLCVIDTKPRPAGLTATQLESLTALARQVESQMELRRALRDRDDALEKAAVADRSYKDLQQTLRDELNHRLKNVLALAQGIASQSLRTARDLNEARDLIGSRLAAIGKAQDILVADPVEGAGLAVVVKNALEPHDQNSRISVRGDDILLTPKAALMLTMTVHELATNAIKYGALSTPAGVIELAWEMASGVGGSELVLLWQEKGGPAVSPPTRRGFGTRLIETAFAAEVGGKASIDFKPGGLEYRLVAPAAGLGFAA